MSTVRNFMTLGTLRIQVESTKATAIRVLQQQFGDGYMARRQDGVNPVIETWNISTPPLPVSNVLALENELITLGSNYFLWTPPNEPSPKKWILDPVRWDWTYSSTDIAKISFVLKRWYS